MSVACHYRSVGNPFAANSPIFCLVIEWGKKGKDRKKVECVWNLICFFFSFFGVVERKRKEKQDKEKKRREEETWEKEKEKRKQGRGERKTG